MRLKCYDLVELWRLLLFSSIKKFVDMRDQAKISHETIARTWGKEVSDVLRSKKFGQTCYRNIAAVSLKYEGRYLDARNALNRIIVARILANRNRQSSRRYAGMMDWLDGAIKLDSFTRAGTPYFYSGYGSWESDDRKIRDLESRIISQDKSHNKRQY